MKMAKASPADIEMALELSRFVEDLENGICPLQAKNNPESDDVEELEDYPDEQHLKIIAALTDIARKGSIFRVTFGMSVLIDPRNELVDPTADTLEPHPKFAELAEANARLFDALKTLVQIEDGDGMGITGWETAMSDARAAMQASNTTARGQKDHKTTVAGLQT